MRVVIYHFVRWILRVVVGLLAIRLILRFFSASPAAPAVAWLYNLTNWLLQPVNLIFPNVIIETGVFDVIAIIGIVFYLIIFTVILRIIRFFLHGPDSII